MELFLSGIIAGIVIVFGLSLVLFTLLAINAPLDPNDELESKTQGNKPKSKF